MRTPIISLLVLLAAAGAFVNAADKPAKKAANAVPAQPRDLVWPLPPETPRIRWQAQFRDLEEIKGKKQQSWMEKVAGAKPASEKTFMRAPYGVAVDSRGRIFVADSGQRTVFVIDNAQRRVDARRGSSQIPLATPIGLAVDENDRLFVSDAFLHDVLAFDADGRVLGRMGITELGRPGGIAIDKKRHLLYAADVKNHRIAVFNTDNLTFLRFIGGPVSQGGREPGRFMSPTNVAVDSEGKLYVTDTFNHRIQIFDAAGKFVRAFGSHGVRPGQFVRPKGIAVDSQGHIYVADAEFNNFQIFSPTGQILMAVGSLGDQPGEFSLIAGLHIDAEDRVFTTEQYSGRVQVFKYLASSPGTVGKEVAASKK